MNEKNTKKMYYSLITGASSGIGRALALEFARHGHALILLARDESRLQSVKEECHKLAAPDVKALIVDLKNQSATKQIQEFIKREGLTIDHLVNNAGLTTHGAFSKTLLEDELEILQVNLVSLVSLTKEILQEMLKRNSGKILNVSSIYAFSPCPYQSTYAASKAFLYYFDEGLRAELKGSGVTLTTLCPGLTESRLRERIGKKDRWSSAMMSAEEVARIAYEGTVKGRDLIVPGIKNKILSLLLYILPRRLVRQILAKASVKRGLT